MNIFVGCSSSNEIEKVFLEEAQLVGEKLKKHHLLIGGTNVGMMEQVINNNQNFTQIILKDYVDNTIKKEDNIICETVFERLQSIWQRSDMFLFLEGGVGTISEIFSFIEQNRTEKNKKPIFILNQYNFYKEIIQFLNEGITKKFIKQDIFENIIMINNIEELNKYIEGVTI